MRKPADFELIAKLECILNSYIESVSAPVEQIIDAINHHYDEISMESVITECLFSFENDDYQVD